TFEGGDFIPLGERALLGCGSRTNEPGIKQILSEGLGFDEIAVVRDPVHPLIRGPDPMVNLHLDTYFNIPADGVAVGCPPLLREAQVELYQKASDDYKYKGHAGNLFDYIKNIGFDLIEITTLEQLCYAANFLCIRSGECVAPDTGEIAPLVIRRLAEKELQHPGIYSPLLAQAKKDYSKLSLDSTFFPHNPQVHAHGIAMTTITLTNATGGYGGAHCMTCVVKR
ncbi:MAG: arginine deiminase family protein, partial [Methanoregulaceae archaeon]|nr:arginine deiminase family protein [Methanoregulaceae archaeon]